MLCPGSHSQSGGSWGWNPGFRSPSSVALYTPHRRETGGSLKQMHLLCSDLLPQVPPPPHAESFCQAWTRGMTQDLIQHLWTTGRQLSFLLLPSPHRKYLGYRGLTLGHPVIQPTHKAGWVAPTVSDTSGEGQCWE